MFKIFKVLSVLSSHAQELETLKNQLAQAQFAIEQTRDVVAVVKADIKAVKKL